MTIGIATFALLNELYVDRGDPGGDLLEAISKVRQLLDEEGLYFSRSTGAILEPVEEFPSERQPTIEIKGKRWIPHFNEKGEETSGVYREVTEVIVPHTTSIPKFEQPFVKSDFIQALYLTLTAFSSRTFKKQNLRYSESKFNYLHSQLLKLGFSEDSSTTLVDSLKRGFSDISWDVCKSLVQKFKHAKESLSPSAFITFASSTSKDFEKFGAEMVKLSSLSRETAEQLDHIAYSIGVTPDVLASRGLWRSNTGNWYTSEGLEDPQEDDLYADYYSTEDLEEHISSSILDKKLRELPISTGSGIQYKLLYHPSMIRSFRKKLKAYTHYFKVTITDLSTGKVVKTYEDSVIGSEDWHGSCSILFSRINHRYPLDPFDKVAGYKRDENGQLFKVFDKHPGYKAQLDFITSSETETNENIYVSTDLIWKCLNCGKVYNKLGSANYKGQIIDLDEFAKQGTSNFGVDNINNLIAMLKTCECGGHCVQYVDPEFITKREIVDFNLDESSFDHNIYFRDFIKHREHPNQIEALDLTWGENIRHHTESFFDTEGNYYEVVGDKLLTFGGKDWCISHEVTITHSLASVQKVLLNPKVNLILDFIKNNINQTNIFDQRKNIYKYLNIPDINPEDQIFIWMLIDTMTKIYLQNSYKNLNSEELKIVNDWCKLISRSDFKQLKIISQSKAIKSLNPHSFFITTFLINKRSKTLYQELNSKPIEEPGDYNGF